MPPRKAYADLWALQVSCTNGGCRQQASGTVSVREVIPGVLEVPRYVCASCGCEMKTEEPR